MNWVFDKINPNKQIDEVGNVVQLRGGVNPVACQKCKTKFTSDIVKVPIEQNVKSYKCTECTFISNGFFDAEEHTSETGHKTKSNIRKRIVGYNTTLVGVLPKITKTQDDVIIECGGCFGIT